MDLFYKKWRVIDSYLLSFFALAKQLEREEPDTAHLANSQICQTSKTSSKKGPNSIGLGFLSLDHALVDRSSTSKSLGETADMMIG